jgi:hypothetical protein
MRMLAVVKLGTMRAPRLSFTRRSLSIVKSAAIEKSRRRRPRRRVDHRQSTTDTNAIEGGHTGVTQNAYFTKPHVPRIAGSGFGDESSCIATHGSPGRPAAPPCFAAATIGDRGGTASARRRCGDSYPATSTASRRATRSGRDRCGLRTSRRCSADARASRHHGQNTPDIARRAGRRHPDIAAMPRAGRAAVATRPRRAARSTARRSRGCTSPRPWPAQR